MADDVSRETLPEPPVPSDCDVRDRWMPMDYGKLAGSQLWMSSTCEEKGAAFELWRHAWMQVPAASLPNFDQTSSNSDKTLQSMSGLGTRKWKRLRSKVLHGFVLCSDGRLYHMVLAAMALYCWEKKQKYKQRGKAGAENRWHKHSSSNATSISTSNARAISTSNGTSNAKAMANENENEKAAAAIIGEQTPREGLVRSIDQSPAPVERATSRLGEALARSPVVRGELDELERKLREAAGVELSPEIGLMNLQPIIALIDEGFDLDQQILPSLVAKRSRNFVGRSWKIYADDIRAAGSARSVKLIGDGIDQARIAHMNADHNRWRLLVEGVIAGEGWPSWAGPAISKPGCLVPVDVLRKHAKDLKYFRDIDVGLPGEASP